MKSRLKSVYCELRSKGRSSGFRNFQMDFSQNSKQKEKRKVGKDCQFYLRMSTIKGNQQTELRTEGQIDSPSLFFRSLFFEFW